MSDAQNDWPGGYGPNDWLDSYNDEAAPQHQFRPNLETVVNGDYDFTFADAKLDDINGDKVCRVGLRVGGRVVEHLYRLKDQRGVNGFLAELAALGFPADRWGAGPGKTPLSQAIPDAVARLPGIRFRGTKTSRRDTRPGYEEKVYHDLLISGRISGAPMPPGPAPARTAAPAAPAAPASGLARVGAGAADIPF